MATTSGANCDDGKGFQTKLPAMGSRETLAFRTIQVRLKTDGRRTGILDPAKLPLRAGGAAVAVGTQVS